MKTLPLALALISALLIAPLSWAQSLSATTQDPIFRLDDRLVLGRVENVYYDDIPELKGVPFMGKIDTGADTTSMHAENIRISSAHPEFKHLKDNELMTAVMNDLGGITTNWRAKKFIPYQLKIKYTLIHPYNGQRIEIEDDVYRISTIRSRTSAEPILRPNLKLPLSIAGRQVDTEVNFTERKQFSAPILIGKTYLEDNAWVFAGYDYLQQQPKAKMIGKQELVTIENIPYKVSISTKSRYANAHALDIRVDKKAGQVSFVLEGENGQRHPMTLPLIRILNTTKGERPLVYLPVKVAEDETQHWLVYLRDRSRFGAQLRLGKDVLNQHFVVDTEKKNLLGETGKSFKSALMNKPLVVSSQETLNIDGYQLPAYPTFAVKTPLMRVDGFEINRQGKSETVTYYLNNEQGKKKKITKPVVKKLRVGDRVRPVVEGEFVFGTQEKTLAFAIDVLEGSETEPFFLFGHKMTKGGVLFNSRADHLLDVKPLFRAGHIEIAEVEGLAIPVKLDTGADVSSISATDIRQFEQDGKEMVSFIYENEHGVKKALTREVVDVMNITAKEGEKPSVRPVVEMHVKLGGLDKTIEVNLQDRERFEFSMILGENFLKHGVVVSSDRDYILTDELDDPK